MLERLIGLSEFEARAIVEAQGLAFQVIYRDGAEVGVATDSYETANVSIVRGKVESIVPVGVQWGDPQP